MTNFYFIAKLNKVISSKNCKEIVTRMREFEWNNNSDNSDYMHVYAFWKSKSSDISIRYDNEYNFVNDLINLQQIEKLSFWKYLSFSLLGMAL